MLDFLKIHYFDILYGIALVYSIIKYRYYFDSILKYFPILIGYTLLSELLGFIIRHSDNFQLVYKQGYSYYNQLIYNIFDVVFFLYFFYVFWQAVKNSKVKKFIKLGIVLFILVSIINPFTQDIVILPQMYAIITGSIVLIFCVLNYLYERREIKNEKQKANLLFWISIGLLTFYLFYPIVISIGILDYELYQQFRLGQINRILIAAMYSCFIIGFAKTKRRVVL